VFYFLQLTTTKSKRYCKFSICCKPSLMEFHTLPSLAPQHRLDNRNVTPWSRFRSREPIPIITGMLQLQRSGSSFDERVRSMCLHHLHVGVLPVSTHDIDLMMNTQYSGLDFAYFNRPYLHACANFLNVSWSSNLKTSVARIAFSIPESGNETSYWAGLPKLPTV